MSAKSGDDEDDDRRGRKEADEPMEQDEEKEPEEVVPETKIEHEIPYIRADVGSEFHFVKVCENKEKCCHFIT